MELPNGDFRFMDYATLELTVVEALRHFLTVCQHQHASLERAFETAKAASIALKLAEDATADLNDESQVGHRIRELRLELVDAIARVRLPEEEAHAVDTTIGGEVRGGRDEYRRLQNALLSCSIEWERATGLRVPRGDLAKFFLSIAGLQEPLRSPWQERCNQSRLASMGFCIPVAVWAVTLVMLGGFLLYLWRALAESKSNPVAHVQFRKHERLRLPVISICPGFSDFPLLPAHPLPLAAVASIEVPSGRAELAMSMLRGNASLHVEQADLAPPSGSGPMSPLEEARCASQVSSIHPSRSRESDSPGPSPCSLCFRFKESIYLYPLPKGRQKVRVTLALNRMASFCMFPRNRVSHQRIVAVFAETLSHKIGLLRDSGFLQDPTGNAKLANATAVSASALFLSAPHADVFRFDSTGARISNRFELQADLFCNCMFMTGLWYPLAAGAPAPSKIGFDWNQTIGYWQRRHSNSTSYWDVLRRPRKVLSGMPSRSPRSSPSFRGGHWSVYAEDSSLARGNMINRSSLIAAVAFTSRSILHFRRSRDAQGRVSVAVPTPITSSSFPNSHSQSLYEYATVDFSFDRFSTEERGERKGWYSVTQFVVDCANMVSLFAGTSVYTLIVSPLLLYIHVHLKRKRSRACAT